VSPSETPLAYRGAKWDYNLLGQWADPAEASATSSADG
jgi:hypothetical protein